MGGSPWERGWGRWGTFGSGAGAAGVGSVRMKLGASLAPTGLKADM